MKEIIEKEKEWTKRELTLRCGIIELAKAVIEQWHKDGRPACDKEAIVFWKQLICWEEK